MCEVRTVGELCGAGVIEIGDGYRTQRSELGLPGYRILRVADILDWRISLTGNDYVSDGLRHAIGAKLSRSGDVLLTTKGTVGRVAIVPDGLEQVVYSPQLCYFRVRDKNVIDPTYLAYWFKSPAFAEQASYRSASSDMAPYISLRDIRTLRIRLPEIDEQRSVVEVLGALDDKIVANDRTGKTAVKLGDTTFSAYSATADRSLVTVGQLSEHAVIEFSDGYRTKKSEHGKPGLRILRAGDVRDSYVYPAGNDYVSQDYSRQIGSKVSAPGDIVLTTKGTVGRVAIVAEVIERVVYSPQVCYFRVTDPAQVDHGYLGAWFRSSDLQRQAATLMYKSDMAPYISLRDIRSLVVPLPSVEEQRRIGSVQRTLMAAFDASRLENEVLARTRDELLPLLMCGKVHVKEADAVVSELA